jgi:hypothetical protein
MHVFSPAAGLFAVFALAACGRSPAPESPGAPASTASTTAAASSTSVPESGLPADHAHTARYAITIDYPPLSPQADVLTQALHQRSQAAKRDFMQALPDPKQLPEFAHRQFQLIIHYKVASRTPAFISVREQGMMDTGGAHPVPLDGTFVFNARGKKLVALDDLFTDPQATRKTLAEFARKALEADLLKQVPGGDKTPAKARKIWQDNMRKMIEAGTQATAHHFNEFLVDAGGLDRSGGLVLVFPPYQVAPYVYGAQTVEVPLKVFADALKPAWRGTFGLAP